MTVCKNAAGAYYTTPGASDPCPASHPNKVTVGTGTGGGSTTTGNQGATPRRPTGPSQDMAYYPREWGQVTVDTSSLAGVGRASDYGSATWNREIPKADALTNWDMLSMEQQDYIDRVAKSIDYRGTGRSLWERSVNASEMSVRAGDPRTPFDFINDRAVEAGADDGNGPGGGGGGGGGGGAAAPIAAGPDAVKRVMDSLANDLLGRTLSDKEFKRYYGSYKSAFAGNPGMDMQQHGIEALEGDDDYQEYQVAQKFATAMDSVLRGAS